MRADPLIRSTQIFDRLVGLYRRPDSRHAGTKLAGPEVTHALEMLDADDFAVTADEVRHVQAFAATMTTDNSSAAARQAVSTWLASHTPSDPASQSPGLRGAHALSLLESLSKAPFSPVGGTKLLAPEHDLLLWTLGDRITPGEVAAVERLLRWSGKSMPAALRQKTQDWLDQHASTPSSPAEQKLAAATKDLLWLSETDSAIKTFTLPGAGEGTVTKRELLKALGDSPRTQSMGVEGIGYLMRRAEKYDGMPPEEEANANRYAALAALMKSELTGVRAFELGRIELDTYVVGRDPQGQLVGIHAFAVAT